MSSAGQVVGGIVGAVAGFFIGAGPQGALIGAQIGMGIGSMIDPPKGPKIMGPRLSDLTTQTSTYGIVIPRAYGTVPIVGNVFWLENNQLKETPHTQSQGKGGGGAETTTFTYSATFAVGLLDCSDGNPIAGARRIWIGANLIYDAGATDVSSIIASGEATPLFKIYNGDDMQLPDPRMQSTLGVANTPAYRGLAYIVFYDLPLEKYQNSLVGAQVKVEVIKNAVNTPALVDTLILPASSIGRHYFSVSDTNSLPEYLVTTTPYLTTGTTYVHNTCDFSLASPKPHTLTVDNAGASAPYTNSGHLLDGIFYAITADDNSGYCRLLASGAYVADLRPTLNAPAYWFYGENTSNPAYGGAQWYAKRNIYIGVDKRNGGVIWNSIFRWPLSASGITAAEKTAAGVDETPGSHFLMNVSNDGYVYALTSAPTLKKYDLDLNLISATSLSYLGTAVLGFAVSGDRIFVAYAAGISLYILSTGVLQRTYTMSVAAYPLRLMPIGGVLYVQNGTTALCINFDAIASQTIALSSIVSAECLKSNLIGSSDIDVTALSSLVRGYTISSIAAIRGGFDPLIGAWPFDVIQSGYKIVFKPRGGSSVVTIPVAKLDARSISGQPGVQITNSREMDSVLPSKVALKYFDSDREYNPGEQYAERLNTQSVNVSAMDLAIVLTADEAAQKAEILLYLYWLERYDVSFKLPPEFDYLEPSDVITITTADASYQLRLTQINYTSDGRLECQAKYNNATVYTSTASGGVGASTGQTLTLSGPTQYELLDIPLLKDVFDTAGFPVAMSGYLSGWPGGILMRSDDVGQTWAQIQGFSKPGSIMGYASNSLSVHNGLLIDKAGILQVLVNQALSSVTELQMLNGANHFAYGVDGRWEIIAAQNCVLQSDGSYILTDLLRGRFGSEWATGLHATNDHLVFLDTSSLQFVASNLNTIGMARTYRGITTGKTIDTDSNRTMTYNGVNLKCLSPVYLNGNRNPSTSDWTLTWLRRTRKGGELRDLVDVPLSETSESYSMDIFSDGTYTTVKRTLAAATPTAVYSSANQVSDFGSNQTTLFVKVYQLSSTTGRGYPLTTSITR